MNVFVSYTRRDGEVTNAMLSSLKDYLSGICSPFVHALEDQNLKYQQLRVVLALIRSHMVVLVVSPLSTRSPWVRFELAVAKILMKPVITLTAEDLWQWRYSSTSRLLEATFPPVSDEVDSTIIADQQPVRAS